MASVNDIFRITYVQELDGVQMSNTAFYQIDDLGTDQPVNAQINELMNSYQQATIGLTVPEWKIVCAIYENITGPATKQTVFATIPGLLVGDSHPQKQVARFNQYSQVVPPSTNPIHRGAWNQSGLAESLSTDGRWNDPTPFVAMQAWLGTQIVLGGGLWTVQPHLRIETAPGPPVVYGYEPIIKCQVSSRCFNLRRRTTSLCAI